MRKMKKLFAFLLTMIMVLGMATSVFAADTYKIQLAGNENPTTTNHVYNVYQLFVGELTTKTEGEGEDAKTVETLANIKYGSAAVAGLENVGKEVPASVLEAITDARAYAQTLDLSKLSSYGALSSSNNWTLTNVPAGYYLIVDDKAQTIDKEDSYSAFIVQVVGDTVMAPKSDKVTSDKNTLDDAAAEVKVNESGVGTVVSYVLDAKIADNANIYDYYSFILADTLSDGLTFNVDSVKVSFIKTVDGKEVKTVATTNDYALYTGEDTDDGHTFEIALLDAKSHPGETVKVTYTATVNSSAVAMVPETNTFKVTYSNDPEHKYKGNYEPGDEEQPNPKPGKPIDKSKDVTGETPEQVTKTYNTELVLTKIDGANSLPGATFKLVSIENVNQTVISKETYYTLATGNEAEGTKFYYLLKNGTYTETAPTDAEYVKVGKGDSNTTAGYIKKTVDGVDSYEVPTDKMNYIDQDLYMLVLGTESQYASTNKYVKNTETKEVNSSEAAPVEIFGTSGADGKITFTGLGAGKYKLVEVDAPDGYNYAADVEFTVTFVQDSETKEYTFTVTDNDNVTDEDGKLATTIVDKPGTVLPETGGMGTTIFYVFGGVLVVAAGILLIAKRRMAR